MWLVTRGITPVSLYLLLLQFHTPNNHPNTDGDLPLLKLDFVESIIDTEIHGQHPWLPLAGRLEFEREGGMVLGVEKTQASLQKSNGGFEVEGSAN